MKKVFAVLVAFCLVGFVTINAEALSISEYNANGNSLDYSNVSGSIVDLDETFNNLNSLDLFWDADARDPKLFEVTKYVTNKSGYDWTAFYMGIFVGEKYDEPSNNDDLIFMVDDTFTSTHFSTIVAHEMTEDIVNFSNGLLADGETMKVTFNLKNLNRYDFVMKQSPTSLIPEPATLFLLGIGMLGMISLKKEE